MSNKSYSKPGLEIIGKSHKRTFVVLVALIILLVVKASTAFGQSNLVGEWEGLLNVPGRPFRLAAEFRIQSGALTGSVIFAGQQHFSGTNIHLERDGVHFELPEAGLVFDGTISGDTIYGAAKLGGKTFDMSLNRTPALPPAHDLVERWRQDLSWLNARFPQFDRSLTPATAREVSQRIEKIAADAPQLADQQIWVRLSQAIAVSGNAHTRLYLVRHGSVVNRIPVRVWWFRDGLFVVAASPVYRNIVGCRVVSIGKHNPREVMRSTRTLAAGNESWTRYMNTYYATSPDVLYGLGLVESRDSLTLGLMRSGKLQTVRFPSVAAPSESEEDWQYLSPRSPLAGEWAFALSSDQIPDYLLHTERNFWRKYIDSNGCGGSAALYIQFNRAQDMKEQSVSKFGEEVLAELRERMVDRVIVDLRFNTGGNLQLAEKWIGGLAEFASGNSKRIYLITGPSTFSAGITHAAQLRQAAGTVVVGEHVGDALDFWSEGGDLTLPNSGLVVHYANSFHKYSKQEYPEFKPYNKALSTSSLDPDIIVTPTFVEYVSGRDPVLKAICRPSESKGARPHPRTKKKPKQ
jgi:hypothetical protein